ncbi:MAG: leucine-rich repeat domain-containing protein, partial [Candidatus Odinarchaeota archaeon]
MAEKSPREILNIFKEGKYTKTAAIEQLFSVFQNSGDNDEIKIQLVETIIKHFLPYAGEVLKWIINNEVSPNCLFELYQYLEAEGEKTKDLRQFMELTIGRAFLKNYDLNPKEAMALELIGRGLVWHHPIYHSDPKDWKSTPYQWTDLYTHKAENGIVIQIWISYGLNEIESKYFKLLSRLRNLYLYDCRLTDYSFLTHLTCLTVSGGDVPQISEIDEIKGLGKLVNLEELDLTYNEISEIKNLDRLVKLKKLDLSKNCIEEIKGLQNLSHLEDLNLECNKISEIKSLEHLINLERLNLSENFNMSKITVKDKPIPFQEL